MSNASVSELGSIHLTQTTKWTANTWYASRRKFGKWGRTIGVCSSISIYQILVDLMEQPVLTGLNT